MLFRSSRIINLYVRKAAVQSKDIGSHIICLITDSQEEVLAYVQIRSTDILNYLFIQFFLTFYLFIYLFIFFASFPMTFAFIFPRLFSSFLFFSFLFFSFQFIFSLLSFVLFSVILIISLFSSIHCYLKFTIFIFRNFDFIFFFLLSSAIR